jgi:hypothetical protein
LEGVVKFRVQFIYALAAGLAGLPLAAVASTPFAGTWVVDPQLTEFSSMLPLGFSIEHGLYKRTSCAVADEVPADGAEHAVAGDPYIDAMSVHIVDDQSVDIVQKTKGVVVWRGWYGIAKDQRSMTLRFEDDRATKPVTGSILFERLGEVVAGAHALSGSWRASRMLDLSASGRTLVFEDIENGLVMRASDGRNFNNIFGDRGGETAPLHGYLDGATVWVSRRAPNKLQINRSQSGTLVEMSIGTVSADGQQMQLGELDELCQARTTWVLRRQPASPQPNQG